MFLRIRAGRGNGKCERREQGGADGGGDLHRHHPRGGKAIRKDRRRIRSGVAHTTDAWAWLVGTSDIRIRSLDRRTHSHASSPRMRRSLTILLWVAVSVLGAAALGRLALSRGETISAGWLLAAALCSYAVAYRFYGRFITAKIFVVDDRRATPAVRMEDGRDYLPTNRREVLGHHFAAIAGHGPLVGPTLAAQFGYLPGTLWILIGAVLGGCVQDFVTLFFSTRRNARSLGQMARDELGPLGGVAALIGVKMLMIVLIAVLGLVVVNAMKHSPWATSTVAATIPIAILIGLYMRHIRPGRVLEGTLIGVALLLLAVVGGGWIDHHPTLRDWFDSDGPPLALMVIAYGFIAAVAPVWLVLAPRDYR